jgi:hypothetical protein
LIEEATKFQFHLILLKQKDGGKGEIFFFLMEEGRKNNVIYRELLTLCWQIHFISILNPTSSGKDSKTLSFVLLVNFVWFW